MLQEVLRNGLVEASLPELLKRKLAALDAGFPSSGRATGHLYMSKDSLGLLVAQAFMESHICGLSPSWIPFLQDRNCCPDICAHVCSCL